MKPWHASGLLFENCNCQVVCPGHVHFSQDCTWERCIGYWAIRVERGSWGRVDLADQRAVVAYASPRHMIDGDWVERLVLDPSATPDQRTALESILSGRSGGPWEKLDAFVGERLPTLVRPIEIEDTERTKRVAVEGLLEGSLETLRGRDRTRPVTIHNMFNQIHAADQVVARGDTRYDDGRLSFVNEGTHGLWSRFAWRVEG